MPLKKLQFRPGVNRESTSLANEGGWYDCDKIRFRSGYPEKLGGWVKDTGTAQATLQPPSGSYWGVCRSMWNWVTLSGQNLLGLGTNLKFYIQNGPNGYFYDITPIRDTNTSVSNAFTVYTGSTTVTVTDPGHGAQTGDFVTVTYVGGAIGGMPASAINGEHQITYLNANQYNFTATSSATSDAGPTGTADFAYQITTGLATYTVSTGWGSGSWGGYVAGSATTTLNGTITNSATTITLTSAASFAASGAIVIDSEYITYSGKSTNDLTGCVRGAQGTTAAAHTSGAVVTQVTTSGSSAWNGWGVAASGGGVGQQLRLWSQSNYGEDLIFNPRGGALYYWAVNANINTFSRATLIEAGAAVPDSSPTIYYDATTPSVANLVLVSDSSRFVICFGTNDPTGVYATIAQDPLQIRWSQQEEFYTWTPAVTNQAGDYRLSRGSEIIAAQQTRQEILVWTDAAVYSMQYLGPPYVWGFQSMGDNISIAGPNVVSVANNITYWMGADKFYMYSGRVETLPCALRQYVYDDINMVQSYQFFSGTNEGYNEIWWFYCSANSDIVDKYVVFNYLEQTWYYGTMERTYWLDSPLREQPMAAFITDVETVNAGALLYHETGNDDGTTTPASPIDAYVQSADFDIDDGHDFSLVTRIIPDITFNGSNVNQPTVTFTVRPRQNPGANYGQSNDPDVVSKDNYVGQRTYNVQQFTQYVYVRVRGRQMAFRVGSTDLGVAWQLGAPRIDLRKDGRR
jgi:hypothetical protein